MQTVASAAEALSSPISEIGDRTNWLVLGSAGQLLGQAENLRHEVDDFLAEIRKVV